MARWLRWGPPDPMAEQYGFTFDMTEAGEIRAPAGKLRVCAYHVDWDERPRCYVDVDTREQAQALVDELPAGCSYNVDYGMVYDEHGALVISGCPW